MYTLAESIEEAIAKTLSTVPFSPTAAARLLCFGLGRRCGFHVASLYLAVCFLTRPDRDTAGNSEIASISVEAAGSLSVP